jgi:hypothetical protein
MKPVLVLVLLLAGCQTAKVRPAPPPPVPVKAITASHEAKDTTIVEEAAKIDAIAPEVKQHTDAQRAAVAAAPAAELKPAFAILESRIAEQDKTIEKQAKHITALQDAELRAQVRTMRWFGFGCILAAVALGYARQIQFAVLAAGAGILSLAAAQLWAIVASHPAFLPTVGALVTLGLVGFIWAAVHAYRKGDLTSKALAEKERLTETLRTIIPVLDDAKVELGDAFKPVLTKLSQKMDSHEKQLIKSLRNE